MLSLPTKSFELLFILLEPSWISNVCETLTTSHSTLTFNVRVHLFNQLLSSSIHRKLIKIGAPRLEGGLSLELSARTDFNVMRKKSYMFKTFRTTKAHERQGKFCPKVSRIKAESSTTAFSVIMNLHIMIFKSLFRKLIFVFQRKAVEIQNWIKQQTSSREREDEKKWIMFRIKLFLYTYRL